jgi:hypothetical protein
LGLTQSSTYRGLGSLAEAGLAEIARSRGQSPVVTLLSGEPQ